MDIVTTRLGVRMTARTVTVMNTFLDEVRRNGGETISFSVVQRPDGTFQVSLGGDYAAQKHSVEDVVLDVMFYWYTDLLLLNAIKNFVVDSPGDGPTRLLDPKNAHGIPD